MGKDDSSDYLLRETRNSLTKSQGGAREAGGILMTPNNSEENPAIGGGKGHHD